MESWERIKLSLSDSMARESFQSWFPRTAQLREAGGSLVVAVPDPETKEWIEKEYGDTVLATSKALSLPYHAIEYVVNAEARKPQSPSALGGASVMESLFSSTKELFSAKHTFDSFVVGSCNQFAHAAAVGVVAQPANRFNPFFIYGGSGLGKTHLLHAIGRGIGDLHPGTRIVYTTGERFVNQLVTCIKNDAMHLFQRYYRSADILLVDDVHTVAGKERTQEEFFHTFNELYDQQKQIVLTSDSPPKDTKGLVERLRTRFEWGLMVDIQPPDLETKLAILDKKTDEEGIRLPGDVRLFLATKTKSSVRALEGALIRLIAFSSMTKAPITVDMARQTIRQLSVSTDRKVSIDSILRAVADRFELQPAQLKQRSNQKQIAFPRQITMYIARELTTASLPEIGRALGGKHHTTVLHSVQKIERERNTDQDLNRLIQSVIDSFQ